MLESGPGRDIAHYRGNSATLYVYFTSLQWDWAINSSPNRFDYINTAVRENQSALLIRDRSNAWYHLGVDGASGSVFEVADVIRATANGRQIITVGASMGGYAALLFGHLVEAKLAIGIVPQIRIGQRSATELQDTRFNGLPAQLERTTPSPHFLGLDLAIPAADRDRFWIVVGSDAWIDFEHAKLVRGRADFRTIVADGCGHNDVGAWCLKSGLLGDVFARHDGRRSDALC